MSLHLFIIDKLLVTWKYTLGFIDQMFGYKTKEGKLSRGVATRKGGKVWTDLSRTLQDIPEYLESSIHYQLPGYMVSQIAINITSLSFSTFNKFNNNSKCYF